MSQIIPINFTVGAFPIGFRGNCQDFANALTERLTGEINLGASGGPVFQAQYGGVQPSTDVGPWWKNNSDLYVFDPATGQYQPMEDQFPIGGCFLWAGGGAPARSLLCQGQQVGRIQYTRLFQRIGGTWGAGDGANTFNLPPGGAFLVSAGFNATSGITYTNGRAGGSVTVVINASNLPPLEVMAQGPANINRATGAGNAYSVGSVADPQVSRWPVLGPNDVPIGGQNFPLVIPPPPFAAMNLCIRYI